MMLGAQIINIAVGAVTAAFATVINYWLGSSQGSRDKDEAVRRFQAVQADETNNAIKSLKSVATTVATTASAPVLAFEAPPTVLHGAASRSRPVSAASV